MIARSTTGSGASHVWSRTHLSAGQLRFLAGAGLYFIFACLAAWLMLFRGLPMLGYFLGASSGTVVAAVFLAALGSILLTLLSGFAALGFMLLTLFSGFARDAERRASHAGCH